MIDPGYVQVSVLQERLDAACTAAQAASQAEAASTAARMQAKLSAAALQEHQATLCKLQATMATAGMAAAVLCCEHVPACEHVPRCSHKLTDAWARLD